MTIKISSKNITKEIKKKLQGAASKSSKAIKSQIVNIVVGQYDKGVSPVKGFNKYKNYKKSTAKRKGRKSPVTLKETGKLHDSLTATQKSRDTITLGFKGSKNNKIAAFHQFGTDNMDARPMLPTRGQKFKQGILNKISKIVKKELKNIK